MLWGSVAEFAGAMDQVQTLFLDFHNCYYPMGDVFTTEQKPVDGYLYSGFFASLLAVVALLPIDSAAAVWAGLQVVTAVWFYAVSAELLPGLSTRGRVLYLLLFLTSLPLLHNFKYGQVSTFITLGIAMAFMYQYQGRSATAGLALAAVASIKYYPGVFVIYFAIQRDTRFLISFAVGMLVFYVMVPALLLGIDGWLGFTTARLGDFPTSRLFYGSPGSQYFVHVLLRWSYNLDNTMSEATYDALRWLSAVLFALHFVLAEWFRRRGGAPARALATVTLLLALPLVVPSSWPHYFIYLPLCQVTLALCVADWAAGSWIRRLWWLPLAVSIASTSIYFFLAFPFWKLYYNVGMLAFASLLSLATVYGLAASMYLQRRRGAEFC